MHSLSRDWQPKVIFLPMKPLAELRSIKDGLQGDELLVGLFPRMEA
jgi:hypothetical protein